jgi:peptide/nickel transport system permease protein
MFPDRTSALPATGRPGSERDRSEVRLRKRPRRVIHFARRSPVGFASLAFLIGALLFAIFGPFLGAGNPERMDPLAVFARPSSQYPMGTDYLGRSVLARLATGLRVSFTLAAVAALLAATIGALVGMAAGYFGGIVDEIIGRIAEVLFAFPMLLLALLIAMVMNPGIESLILTVLIAIIPIFIRVARGPTLSVKHAEYTIAARVGGASTSRILLRHILPNVSTPLLVQLAFSLSGALIVESALSFLGLGIQPPRPSLGSLLRDGKTYMEIAPWTMLFPAIALASIILAINLLGDELQSLTDPRLRKR